MKGDTRPGPFASHGLDHGHRQPDGPAKDDTRKETAGSSRKDREGDARQDATDQATEDRLTPIQIRNDERKRETERPADDDPGDDLEKLAP